MESASLRYKGYTHAEALEELETWKAAKRRAANGRSYQLGSRMLTRYDLPEINAEIKFFSNILDYFEGAPAGLILVSGRMRRE